MRSIVTLALGCLLASSLAACGGSHTSSSAVPQAQQSQAAQQKPNGEGRRTRSGCSPDSYGYCLLLLSHTKGTEIYCGGYYSYTWFATNYELYYYGEAEGQYTYTQPNYDCQGGDAYWTPADPAESTGDPNLP